VRCIRTGDGPVSDGRKGADVVRVLERASRSMVLSHGKVELAGQIPA
jgi:hypothetical protein